MSRNDERPSKEMYEQRTAMLPFPVRQELVGKRFLVIIEEGTRRSAKNQSLENYCWKQGYIRACSVKDIHDRELQVLVEFDGASWECRQWIKIYEQTKAFFVEKTIIWAARVCHGNNRGAISWPALIFVPLLDCFGFDKDSKHPVEYFGDKQLVFLKENEFELFKDNEENRKKVVCLNALVQKEFLGWQRLQKTQACLMKGTETLTGARVTVYRQELRQWYTGCITSHNLTTRELHVMDDNVLQTHPEHPALVQIELMADDDELHRLLLGEQTKILPTRRQRNSQMYYQSNCPSEQKSHGGIASKWHMFHDCRSEPGWSRPSVVRAVNSGKPAFVPIVGNDVDSQIERSPQSLPSQNDRSSSKKETNNDRTCESHSASNSATTFKLHKPIPLVAKPSNPALLPHYSPQPSRPSTSPLLSSLNCTSSPLGAQVSASPLSGRTTSPQSLRNQSSPQNSRKESPFNISLCDQSTARVAAQKEMTRARNHENHRNNFQSMSSRKSSITKTPEKSKQNSNQVDNPSVSSSPTQLVGNHKNTEARNRASLNPGKETIRETSPRTATSKSPISESPVPGPSPGSQQPSVVFEEGTRNFGLGIATHRKEKTSARKTATIGNLDQPNMVIADTISPERSHSSRMENERNEGANFQNVDANPVSMPNGNTPPRSLQFNGAQGCEHLRTIAQIQLEYLIFLEALVRFQHSMVVEAVHTINQTSTKEQFCFVSDFFCKLVENNRHTEKRFREATVARQDRQRAEHQRHLPQEAAASPSRVFDCLPEEIKRKLRTAEEAVNREREEVLSVILPLEEYEQRQGQQTEWGALKQHLQKHQNTLYHESIHKPYRGEEKTQLSRQGADQSQKLNTVQGRQQHQDVEKHHNLSWFSSQSSDRSEQVDVTKEMKKTEQQRKKLRAPDEPQQTNRQAQSSPTDVIKLMKSQAGSVLLQQQQAAGSELLRASQHLQLSLPLREQQCNEEVQKKMVNELFQMKDIEQKTILLQHIVQQLQSQKASSRSGLKSPPSISHNFGMRTTDNQLAKVQNKQSTCEANELIQPHVSKSAVLSYPSPDQLLSTLSTSAVRRVTDNLQITAGVISEQQSVPLSRNPEKCNSELLVEKELSTSGSSSILVDAVSGEGETRRVKDDTGSVRITTEKSNTKKRKPPPVSNQGGPEIQPKFKRQRKSAKKNLSGIGSQDNVSPDTPPGSTPGKQVPVKSFSPGEVKPLTLISSDRNVNPVKANSEQFSAVQYQPRSITKGIGFVPFTADTASKASATSSTGDPLDVLATVSTSIRTNKSVQNVQRSKSFKTVRNLPPSYTDGNRQLSDDSTNDDYATGKSKAAMLGGDLVSMSADGIQETEGSLRAHRRSTEDQRQASEDKRPISECSGSIMQDDITNVNDINTSHALSGSLVKDQSNHVPSQSPANLVEFLKNNTVDVSNFAGLNDTVNKTKKPKNDTSKKDKKSKTQGHSNKGKTVSNTTAQDMCSLLYGEQIISGNTSDAILSTVEDERRPKQTLHETCMSLDCCVTSSDIGTEAAVEPEQRSALKFVVSDTLKNTDDHYRPSVVKQVLNNPKPMHLTYPECDKTFFSDASIDQASTQIEKPKNKDISSGKISIKKEKKSKSDGSKSKKSSEKKPKTSRGNKLDKETDTKCAKKSSKLNSGQGVSKSKDNKQSHEESIDVIHESSNSVETAVLNHSQNEDKRKIPGVVSKNGELCDEQEKSTGKHVVNGKDSREKTESRDGKNKSLKSYSSSKEASSVTQKSLHSKLDYNTETISNKEENSVKETGEKKQRKKSDNSKTHSKKLSGEQSKKNLHKDEKGSKIDKKPNKKSEKDNLTSSRSNTKLQNIVKEESLISQDSAITVDEFLSNVINENEHKNDVKQEQKVNEETNGFKEKVITTNILNKENGVEKAEDSKNIVFINDQSVGSFVKGSHEGNNVHESLFPRKRKRSKSPHSDHFPIFESNGVELPAEARCSENGQTSTKKPSSRKPSESSEKKETKARKKKVKKEGETKSEDDVTMETDLSLSTQCVKKEEKIDSLSDAKKQVKKAKEPKEKKIKEKVCKEEWTYFLQRGGCKGVPSMSQCRECRNYDTEEEAVLNKSCCRFDMFRRCRSKSNKLEMAGFSSSEHAQGDDLLPWIADKEICKYLSLEVSKYILLNVGDEFCNLVKQEEEAFSWETKKETIAWKRAVRGIREMCDACATTIFNVHWVCPKCGFGVCLDCYRTKLNSSVTSAEAGRAKRFLWVRCSVNTSHRPKRLVLTHIIPKKTLNEICEQLHEARELWGIGKNCPCKTKDIGDNERIQELPDHEKDVVVDVVNTSLEAGKVEESKADDQSLELPMETEGTKVTEKEQEVKKTVEDTSGKLVKDETSVKLSEKTESTLPEYKPCETLEVKAEKTNEGDKSSDLDQSSEDNKSSVEKKVSECKDNELSLSDNKLNTSEGEQKSSSETSQFLQCEDKDSTKSTNFVEKSCDVTIVGNGLGALSLLLDYQSPVSSPAASPVREMECEESYDITSVSCISTAEEALLSRPSATQGESSAMTRTSSETVDVSPMNIDIPSEQDLESSAMTTTSPETVDVSRKNIDTPSGEDRESEAKMEESLATTEESSSVTGEISSVEDISARVQARITGEIPAPHSWICHRPMLRLHHSHHDGNLVAFQSRWEKGEPILVSGVHENMTSHLWTPEGFENEFGTEKADVVNCKTGGTLEKMDIGTFWRGFESVKDRPLDNKGEPTLLKLKDWPPEADFVEKMPKRFKDLMGALPLPEYTSREGTRNLVARLPNFFVKPDLGPKMYNAYGNAAFPSAGTTNLHIDMSDAVNVMVYVGVPFDKEYGEQERRDSLACIDVACDEIQQQRARKGTEKLGALWHIFAAADANKIRALFHKVCREKNMKYPASHDPIHDQCFYLDEPLLKRLKDEYGVVGWPIAQFLGDAIFIPAGAPHQVRNLHSCVKAAEDFVSPEHVGHCFKLTEEFRHLSEKHTNHEDKLQVKNIIYHAVKDAVSVLRQHEKTSQTEETGNENV